MEYVNAHAVDTSGRGLAETVTALNGAIRRALMIVRTWHSRACTRRELARLDDHLLADIGLSRAELNKPFWQA